MKNLSFEKTEEILCEYMLTVEEMICIKGGESGEPILMPTPPPPKL